VTYERLRLAREEKGWTIEELSRRAGIRPRTIELIDRGEFGELPAGLYGRASIRSYATAVGLDAAAMVEAVRPLLASEGDPLGALARRCGHTLKGQARTAPIERPGPVMPTATTVVERPVAAASAPAPAAAAVAVLQNPTPTLAVAPEPTAPPVVEMGGDPITPSAAAAPDPGLEELRLTADPDYVEAADVVFTRAGAPWIAVEPEFEPPRSFEPPRESSEPGRQWWRPAAASAIDGAFLIGIGLTLVWLTALVGATSVPVVLRAAGPGIALVFALIVSLYFVLFGGVGNGTPGGTLMRLESRPSGRTILNAREVFGRAARAVYRDSLVAD
jgi:hypothetical protein